MAPVAHVSAATEQHGAEDRDQWLADDDGPSPGDLDLALVRQLVGGHAHPRRILDGQAGGVGAAVERRGHRHRTVIADRSASSTAGTPFAS